MDPETGPVRVDTLNYCLYPQILDDAARVLCGGGSWKFAFSRELADAAGADGFLWYPWLHGNYDAVLSEPEWVAQQRAVYDIYARYVAPSATP